MSNSKFITEFGKIYKKSDWMTQEDFAWVYSFFLLDRENNELFLIEELKKYSIEKWSEYLSHYHRIMWFILYLWNNEWFKNQVLTNILKWILEYIISGELPEKYWFTLRILFSINKDDHDYYINQYKKLRDEWKLYHDINEEFLEIFIDLKINDLFLETFQQNIIDHAIHVHNSLEKWFRYLISLNDEDFRSIFLKLLEFFNIKENKFKLIHYHEYNSLIRTYDKDNFKDILLTLWEKITSSWSTEIQIKEIKDFIINDIDFAIERHERNLSEILFINSLFQTFHNQDKEFLLDVLKWIKTKHITLSIEAFIVENLDLPQIEDLIKMYKWWENEIVLYFVYDKFTYLKNEEFIKIFDNSSMKKEFKKRNKLVLKNQEKYKEKEEKRRLKEKAVIFWMLNPWKDQYYPKLFQDYVSYLKKDWWLLSLFKQDEIEKINSSIREQVITYLEGLKIKDYSDTKIQKILTFEKKENNSYTYTWNSAYLWWILDIAKSIQFDISKYYKSYVLFFPLLWWSEKIKETFEVLSGKIKKTDIDYLLKAYTQDLHKNAKDLRYFHIDSITEFYQKFKNDFSKPQKKRLMELSLSIIDWGLEDNIYIKNNFLQIYSEIWWEKKLERLFHEWLRKYPNYNYFKDVLDNSEIEKEDSDKRKFIMFIARELCKTYSNKSTALWSIDQVKNWKIEVIDTHQIKYPHTFSTFSWISEKESEFRWGSDNDSFSYIFWIIPNIDVFDEMLGLLNYSFQIQKELYSGKLKWEYESYCFYIRNIFHKYLKGLNIEHINKSYYTKIEKILSQYEYKITYNFQISEIQKIFWVDIEEKAKRIIEDWGIQELVSILSSNKELNEENSRLITTNQELNKELWERPEKDKSVVLFVEGITDKTILINAWIKLYGTKEIPFRIENWYSAGHIRNLFIDHYSVMDSDTSKCFIGMLDFDSAFNEYNSIKNWDEKEKLVNIWLLKKHQTKNGYVFLLPVPDFRKKYAQKIYWGSSLLSIEFLFRDKIILKKDTSWKHKYVEEIEYPWIHTSKLYKFRNSPKKDFADMTNAFDKEEFQNFIPIFHMIDMITNWKYS
jgi:hypothetical protein